MHRLEMKIRAANEASRVALIPFLTAGFPSQATFWPTLLDLDRSGADIIEIGIPFSDPVADGPVVEAASRQALSEGIRLENILKELQSTRSVIQSELVLMGYYNPFLQYGLERLAKDAEEAGVAGIIVPDLPYDEASPMKSKLKAHDIALIPLVGPNTSVERMRLYANDAEGYCYVVSVMGVTGARTSLPPEVGATLARAKQVFNVPLALGFGLTNPAQLADLDADAKPNACVFGSALLQHLSNGGQAHDFIARWL
ncbi:MAG: tryptophan synthase subunit alpha [Desulfovibrionaceae bacterium]|nr:tryptophan synthase subunit alpha [Desulfovibrionaceae bacterium]